MKDDVLQAAPPPGVRFEQDTEVARLVEVLATPYYRFDTDLDQMRRDRYLETATGLELEMRADPVGVQRPAGEGDDTFRRRALSGRYRSMSDTTFSTLARLALAVFDADPTDIKIFNDYDTELGAVIFEITSDLLDDAPFSESTIISFLNDALPGSRRAVLRRKDGFQFSDPSTTDEKSGAGFGEGAWTK